MFWNLLLFIYLAANYKFFTSRLERKSIFEIYTSLSYFLLWNFASYKRNRYIEKSMKALQYCALWNGTRFYITREENINTEKVPPITHTGFSLYRFAARFCAAWNQHSVVFESCSPALSFVFMTLSFLFCMRIYSLG